MLKRHLFPIAIAALLIGCGKDLGSDGSVRVAQPTPAPSPTATTTPIVTTVIQRAVASFDDPWAMAFLPNGRALVTEKPGRLQLVMQAGAKTQVAGVPRVAYSGQSGLQDIVLDPGFANNARISLTYVEPVTDG